MVYTRKKRVIFQFIFPLFLNCDMPRYKIAFLTRSYCINMLHLFWYGDTVPNVTAGQTQFFKWILSKNVFIFVNNCREIFLFVKICCCTLTRVSLISLTKNLTYLNFYAIKIVLQGTDDVKS